MSRRFTECIVIPLGESRRDEPSLYHVDEQGEEEEVENLGKIA